MNEQVRHRAVQALEGEPGKVARAQTCCPPETKLGPSMWSAEGLGGRGGRRSRVVRRVGKLLAQLQVVQNEPVAVVGNAQTVRGLAIGGGGKVGADPGGQPGARVGALRQQRPVQRAHAASTQQR